MKKILTTAFALGLLLSLAACGANKPAEDESKPGSSESGVTEKVLEDKESYAWAIHGDFVLADGTNNGWNGKANELYEKSTMTAISLKEAAEIDADLGAALAQKQVKHLYKYEGAEFGTREDITRKIKVKKSDGKFYYANASLSFKAVKLSYDAEEEVYAETQWIYDPKTAHAELLAGDMFIPAWQEQPDADGFTWASDGAILSGPGKYTVVVAEYNVAVGPTTPNYGIAVIKTQEKEGHDYEEILDWVATEHTYGVIGDFDGNSWASDFAAMNRVGETLVWQARGVSIKADKGFKVRADADWTNSWGYSSVDTTNSSSAVTDPGNGNITVNADGAYDISIDWTSGTPVILIVEDLR